MNKDYINSELEENNTINIREEVEKYFIYWRWFVICVIFSIFGAFLFLRYSTPLYRASTSILIKDNKKSGISTELAAFGDLGIVGGGSSNNTDNEIEILRSRKIIGNVVDSLDLTTLYFVEGRIKQTELYETPITVEFIDKSLTLSEKDTAFSITIKDENSFDLIDIEENVVFNSSFNKIIKSNLGTFKVVKKESKVKPNNKLQIKISARDKVIDSYKNRVNISPVNKNSSVLNLSLKDVVKEKAEDFLNVLVNQYNKDAISDKNEVSQKTKEFIDDRLENVYNELSSIQDDVKNYKTKTGTTGIPKEGELVLENVSKNNKKLIEAQIQLTLAKGIEEDLNLQTGKNDILASDIGLSNESISQSIISYNLLIQRRNKLQIDAGDKNPQLLSVKSEIFSAKKNIKQSINNLISSLQYQFNELKVEQNKMNSKRSSIPSIERGFIDIARQQEIISGLYSYLLKKKEETAISLAVAVPNAKIIDVAYGLNIPVSPKRKIIYLAALLLGLIIPFVFIYLKDLLDTKVHNKKDIEENISIPFLGDIPRSDVKEKIVIGTDVRSSTAEAFRLVRTNLDFMLANKRKESKTIFITSTTSGEGKSFISINISATLAMSGKKVLLMGMDLRAPKVTEYLGLPNKKGVTNYITDENLSVDDLKFTIPEVKGLDIISSGVIPPNPAELLMTKRVENLFTILQDEYDVIIVDTAPVNLVTDTLLISKYADMFMYIVRANYLDKRLLAVSQNLYNEKRLPNMAIVLNDTDPKRSYGYGYGGYGYGYVEEEKPWYKKIFKD